MVAPHRRGSPVASVGALRDHAAAAVVVAGAAVAAFAGDGPRIATLGWALAERTPPRTLALPIFVMVAAALAVAIVVRDRPAWHGMRGVARWAIVVAAMTLASDVVPLLTEPLAPEIHGVERVYVVGAALLALVAMGAAAGAARTADPVLRAAAWSTAALALLRLTAAPAYPGVAALLAGAALGIMVPTRAWSAAPGRIRSAVRGRETLVLAAICAVALVFRLMLVRSLWVAHGMDYFLASDDGDRYDRFAWEVARGDDSSRVDYWFNLYVNFLAGVYRVFGHSFVAAGVTQSLLGVVLVVTTYVLGRRIAGPAVGLAAALAVAVDSLLISMAAFIGAEALANPAVLASCALLCLAIGAGPRRVLGFAAAAGLLLGVGVAARDILIALPVPLAVWLAWAGRRRGWPAARVVVACALFASATAAVAVPYLVYRERIGLMAGDDRSHGTGSLAFQIASGHRELVALGIGPDAGLAASLAAAAADPAATARAAIGETWWKTDAMYFTSWFPSFDPTFLVSRTPLSSGIEVVLLALLVVGTISLLRRSDRATVALPILVVAYGFVAYVLVFQVDGGVRYRALFDPLLLIAVAAGARAVLSRAASAS